MKSFPKISPRILSGAIAVLLCGGLPETARSATFTWQNNPTGITTGSITDGSRWLGGNAPQGIDPTDILIFGGSVGTTIVPTYFTATSNSLTSPFRINQINFQGTTTTPGSGPVDTINGGTTLLFGGTNPTITQSGSAALLIDAPIRLGANLTLAGNTQANDTAHDKANITLNGPVSGNFNITKNGSSTFRFGSLGAAGNAPSDNTWFGGLTINDGTIRFNNNAYTAPTALRANPVTLTLASALLTTQFKPLGTATNQDPASSLRLGALNGNAGTVEAKRETTTANVFASADITITALSAGSFGGTLSNVNIGAGDDSGTLNIRGVGTQTFTGLLNLSKDLRVGDIATAVLAGSTTLSSQISGALVLGGGTVRLDNSTVNNADRLRDANAGSTGVETIGGGTLAMVGNAAGTFETLGRLQLGSGSVSNPNPRSGAVTISVVHNASTSAITGFAFQSYAREATVNPYDTVNFTAKDGAGTTLALGVNPTSGARVTFNFTVPLFNGLLGSTSDATAIGWATVNGSDFATYGLNGVAAVAAVAAPVGTGTGLTTTNASLTGNLSLTNTSGYSLNSLKLAPTAAGQVLDLASTGKLLTNAILLAGTTDYTISATGNGTIGNAGGTSARYFQVANAMLTVSAGLGGAVAPLVKTGAGALVLTNTANNLVTQPTVINEGTVRATPGSSLPEGELRFRGGVLEITGGGTLSRTVGLGSGKITWSGVDGSNNAIGQDQGSGGFAAVGADATVHLTPIAGSDFLWEDVGFVNSGHALVFGSTRANAKVTWVDNIGLTSINQTVNYNARQFRAIDNPATTTDVAVLSGTISGSVHDDFLKTGNGELVLTGNNTYAGATLITDGTLRVNGATTNSFLTDVRDGGTLGGSGTVAGVQVEANGTVAPGDFAGHASVLSTSDLKFAGGTAKLAIELGGTTAGGNIAGGYDRVSVTGGVTLAGAQLLGTLLNSFAASPTDLFFIIINDGADAVQGTFAQGGSVTIGTQVFTVSYVGNFTGNAATDSFTGGNDVVLQLASVPEPASATLLLLGALGCGLRRRR